MSTEAHTNRPTDNGSGKVDLKEYFTRWLQQFEQRVDERFVSLERLVEARLAAQRDLSESINAASKEAILKAEASQNSYNLAHNDLAHKQEVQSKEMVRVVDADNQFKAVTQKMDDFKTLVDTRFVSQDKEMQLLRDYRSQSEGGLRVKAQDVSHSQYATGIYVAVGLGGVGAIFSLIDLILRLVGK